ncbi:MAG: CRR6 family NdhI maturation factor [Prochlorothrix sp.]
MTLSLTLTPQILETLNLSPALALIDPLLEQGQLLGSEPNLSFTIEYPQEQGDPRELSEIPEIRLWFIRLDARYPWLPLILDWKGGELARYTAMLVPHQFHPTEGIQYNPEALEIFVMNKTFVLLEWLQTQGITGKSRIQDMAQMLGYELVDEFFALVQ